MEYVTSKDGKLIGRKGQEVYLPEGYVAQVIAVPVNSPEGQVLKSHDARQCPNIAST